MGGSIHEIAATLLKLGKFDEARKTAEEGIARGLDDRNGQEYWGNRFVRAEVLRIRGEIQEASRYLESEGWPDEGEIALRGSWSMHRGYCLGLLGRYGESAQLLQEAGQAALEANLPKLRCEVLLRQGMIHYARREYAASHHAYDSALSLCEEFEDWYLRSAALAGVGKNLMVHRDFAEAIPWFDESLAIAEKVNARYSVAGLWGELAVCYMGLGNSAKSLDLLKEAERVTLELGAMPSYQVCMADIGNVYLHRGDCVTAMTYYERALRLAEQIKDPVSVKKWNHNLHLAFQKFREGSTKTANGI